MGSYARPKNPQTVPNTKIRDFEGIGGPRTQILKRYNYKGWDLSNTVSNDVTDLHLSEKGSALLRPGMRRLGSEDYTIGWIGQINIGGLLKYGIIYNNSLTMVDMSTRLGYDLIPWPDPVDPTPSDWPDGWPEPDDAKDEILPEDPSLPLEAQVCAADWEWTSSPDTLTWTMPYAGTPVADDNTNWYWRGEGYRPEFLTGTYSGDAAWYDSALLQGASWDIGPCHAVQWGGFSLDVTGKDSASDWLDPGVYTDTKTLRISDGTDLEVIIQITVVPPAITLSPTSWSEPLIKVGDSGNKTQTVNVKNSGAATSSLEWEYVLTGDAVLTAILTADKASGTLASGIDEDVVFTMTAPGSVAAGSYSATITFRDSRLNTITGTVDVTLAVTPAFTGNMNVHLVKVDAWGTVTTQDTTATYFSTWASSPQYSPAWVKKPFEGWDFYAGKRVSTGNWTVEYWVDSAVGGYGKPITSFTANGCPSGTYVWTVVTVPAPSTWTLTLSEA